MANKKAKGPLPEEHVRKLARRLIDGQLSVFVGAGLSHLAPAKDGSDRRLPLWSGLTDQVASACDEDAGVFAGDPLDLFDAIVYGQERGRLESAVATALDDSDYDLAPAHHALGHLPWRAVVTTNYDGLLQRLLNEEPIISEDDYDRRSAPEAKQPRLFQIHGTRLRPHTLTKEDYRLWQEKHPRSARHIFELLERGTILFVGYSLSDPHLDAILATVRQMTQGREKRLYAWMWRYPEQKIRLLDQRDKIEAISIEEEVYWEAALRQIEAAAEDLRREEAPAPASDGADPFAYDREQYLQAVRTRFGSANLQGLYVWGAGYARDDVALEEVFVEPDLLRQEPGSREESDLEVPTTLRELRRRREERPDEMRLVDRRLPAFTLFQQEPRLTVVGAPGQGKSTLLRSWLLKAAELWAADPAANPLPILVRLAEWERVAIPGEAGLIDFARHRLPHLGEIGSNAVESWLEGSVLWLLDGVDEVRDRYEREHLREEVLALARRRPGDRWIVSTRPAGDPAGRWTSGWTRSELPSLTDQQIEAVLSAWGRVLEAKEGLALNARDMARDLQRDPGLRAIRGNALLLTLAVLFYKTRRRLPKDRWEFLAGAEQALRDSWVHHRVHRAADHLPGAYLAGLLERLALLGMEEGLVLFPRERLEEEATALLAERGYTGAERDREIERFLRAAEDLIGILVAQGPDQFGFLHLTFQEFLAARALVNRSAEAPEYVARYWDHPDWGEVWVLYALGIESDQDRVVELHETILASGHPLDEHLDRQRLMSLKLAGGGSAPLQRTAQETLEWAGYTLRSEPTNWKVLDTWRSLAQWDRVLPDSLVNTAFAALESEEREIRIGAAETLRSAASDRRWRDVLLRRLQGQNPNVRWASAKALKSVGSEPAVYQALIRRLDDEDSEVRWASGDALGPVSFEPEVRQELLARLDSPDAEVQMIAAATLSARATEEPVWHALLAKLSDQHALVSAAAAISILPVVSEPAVRRALLERLHDQDPRSRGSSALLLGNSVYDPTVRQALVERLRDDDGGVRFAAASALESAVSEGQIRQHFLECLGDNYSHVRWSATRALSAVATEPEVRHALLERFDDENPLVRMASVSALGRLVLEQEERQSLLQRLDDQDSSVRAVVAEALGFLGSDPDINLALLQRLEDQDSNVRRAAARALSGTASEPTVLQALLQRLQDRDSDVRRSAVEALAYVASALEVREALLRQLEDQELKVQDAAAESLRRGIVQEKFDLEREASAIAPSELFE